MRPLTIMSHIKLVYGATPSGEIDYCEAFEQLDSGLCVIGADGSVAANNQAFRDFLGLPADWVSPVELAGKTVSASEELVAGWRARVKTLGDFAETFALTEELNLRVKGKTLASGGVSLSVARAADNRAPVAGITTQAAAQRALRESEAKFQALFEGAGVGISLIDADGTILADIPHIPSKFVEIVPLSHRQGNCIPYAAIRWHDFGNRPAFGRPLGHFSRHPDTPLLSLSPRRRFPRPTPERVFVADHQSSSGFSGTGPSAPPPQPIGT